MKTTTITDTMIAIPEQSNQYHVNGKDEEKLIPSIQSEELDCDNVKPKMSVTTAATSKMIRVMSCKASHISCKILRDFGTGMLFAP